MSSFHSRIAVLTGALVASASALVAQTAPASSARKVLTPDTYDSWRSIVAPGLSPNGAWAAYTLTPAAGNGDVILRATHGATEYRVARGYTGRPMLVTTGTPFRAPAVRFSSDSRHAVFLAYAPRAAFDSARMAKRKTPLPVRLVIVNLDNGESTAAANVATFALPRDNGRWLVYAIAKDSAAGDSAARDTAHARAAAVPGAQPRPIANDTTHRAPRRPDVGAPLVVRDLTTGVESRIADVNAYVVDPRSRWVAYAVAARADSTNGVFVRDLATGATRTLVSGAGHYRALVADSAGTQVAFVTDRDDHAAKKPAYALYHAPIGGTASRVVAAGAFGRDTLIATDSVAFTRDGARITFGVAPVAPDSVPTDSLSDKAVYDLWNYHDARLQPEQRLRANADRKRTYLTVYDVASRKTIRIGSDSVPGATIGRDGRYALLLNESAYALQSMWGEDATDAVAVDLATGARQVIARALPFRARLSDEGRYVVWFDSAGWHAYSLAQRRAVNLTARLPHVRFDQETWDTPSAPAPWGIGGWTRDDARVLVYDRYDVWSLDPRGEAASVNVTDSAGARSHTTFRVVRDRELDDAPFASDAPLLLSAFNVDTKASGFSRVTLGASRAPQPIVMADALFGTPQRSRSGGEYLVTRETVTDFPNLYVGTRLDSLARITDANPQQREYRWPSVELVHWMNDDRVPLTGLLYKPDGFDPSRQYPMVVYYYEKLSDQLHKYSVPAGRNVVNPSVYTSHGYLVFFPDIAYTTGYPGQSALKSIVPGVQMLLARGYVKRDAIGCAGQSWGGYQTAFMVTQTNIFRACFAGAPVANMTSAYGGIRWESGRSRQFQYEHTQSRIGGSLWEYRARYIENSPLFYADRVETPLLIMSNDADGAVPWYQGIELFSALKRLGKEAYLVVYNGDAHNPVKDANKKDVDRKMLQFFAHHLQGEPAPEWMVKGIPFLDKGRDQLAPAPAAARGAEGSAH